MNIGNRKQITLYSKLKILMREALEIQKAIDLVVVQFQFDKAYQEERKLQLMEQYAAVIKDICRYSSEAVLLKGKDLETRLITNI
jgi:hypothetical protein